jgi:hypothetical protein
VFIREFQKDKTPYPYGLEFDKRVEMEMLKTAEGIQLLQALGGMIPKDDE